MLRLIRAELDRVAADGLTAEEVARGRGQLKGGLVLGLEDTGSRMSRLGKSELSYGEYLPVREVLARLDAVDEDAGPRRSPPSCSPGDTCLAVVGPYRESDLDRLCDAGPAGRRHGALSRGVFAVGGARVAGGAVRARPRTCPSAPAGVDKLVHVACSRRWRSPAAGPASARRCSPRCSPVYAAVSELLQELTALQRDGSLGDWLADVVGVLAGLRCGLRRAERPR